MQPDNAGAYKKAVASRMLVYMLAMWKAQIIHFVILIIAAFQLKHVAISLFFLKYFEIH